VQLLAHVSSIACRHFSSGPFCLASGAAPRNREPVQKRLDHGISMWQIAANSEFQIPKTGGTLGPLASTPILIDRVYDQLMVEISECRLRPGQRIRQAELAASLGVSRQPVSHALQLLKRQRLVEDVGRKGLQVTSIEPSVIRNLYQLRTALDGLATRLAAEQVASGIADAAALLDVRVALEQGMALEPDAASGDFVRADVAFHRAVYHLSGNPAIGDVVSSQWAHLMRAMATVLASQDYRRRAWTEHREILRLVLAGEAKNAEIAARRHTDDAGRETIRRLEMESQPAAT
jgi:DNA-binding GntR family transcriptional regulator